MTGSPAPGRRFGPALATLVVAFLAAAAWGASGVASPAFPRVEALAAAAPCPCLQSPVVDEDRGPGSAKEVVESVGVSIPTPWKPVKGVFGRPAAAADVGSAMPEGSPGVAGAVGGFDPGPPPSAPEGVLHGPSPPDR
jgi:hypothetical protein